MNGFTTYRTAYRRLANPHTLVLPITEIGVQERSPKIPDLDRDRLISVLEAIRLERPLPPVEVTASPVGSTPRLAYWLYHGRHRLAASMALGFALVPALIVKTVEDIKRDEGVV